MIARLVTAADRILASVTALLMRILSTSPQQLISFHLNLRTHLLNRIDVPGKFAT
jgi:hypothetical protein